MTIAPIVTNSLYMTISHSSVKAKMEGLQQGRQEIFPIPTIKGIE